METFLLSVELTGRNGADTIQKVCCLIKELLPYKCSSSRSLRDELRSRLPSIIDEHFLVWVDPMGKSFFINISVKNKKNILICAAYRSLDTLKNISALRVAKLLDDEKNAEKLEIPRSLVDEVLYFFR